MAQTPDYIAKAVQKTKDDAARKRAERKAQAEQSALKSGGSGKKSGSTETPGGTQSGASGGSGKKKSGLDWKTYQQYESDYATWKETGKHSDGFDSWATQDDLDTWKSIRGAKKSGAQAALIGDTYHVMDGDTYKKYEDDYAAWKKTGKHSEGFDSWATQDDLDEWKAIRQYNSGVKRGENLSMEAQSWVNGLDPEVLDAVKSWYGGTLEYDLDDPEDVARQKAGQLPKNKDKYYTNSEIDRWLWSMGLPSDQGGYLTENYNKQAGAITEQRRKDAEAAEAKARYDNGFAEMQNAYNAYRWENPDATPEEALQAVLSGAEAGKYQEQMNLWSKADSWQDKTGDSYFTGYKGQDDKEKPEGTWYTKDLEDSYISAFAAANNGMTPEQFARMRSESIEESLRAQNEWRIARQEWNRNHPEAQLDQEGNLQPKALSETAGAGRVGGDILRAVEKPTTAASELAEYGRARQTYRDEVDAFDTDKNESMMQLREWNRNHPEMMIDQDRTVHDRQRKSGVPASDAAWEQELYERKHIAELQKNGKTGLYVWPGDRDITDRYDVAESLVDRIGHYSGGKQETAEDVENALRDLRSAGVEESLVTGMGYDEAVRKVWAEEAVKPIPESAGFAGSEYASYARQYTDEDLTQLSAEQIAAKLKAVERDMETVREMGADDLGIGYPTTGRDGATYLDLEAQESRLQAALAAAKAKETEEAAKALFDELSRNADFASLSAPIRAEEIPEGYGMGWDDEQRQIIRFMEHEDDAARYARMSPEEQKRFTKDYEDGGFYGTGFKYYSVRYMTPEQKQTFYYLCNKQGADAAQEYLDDIMPALNAQAYAAEAKYADYKAEHAPLLSDISTVLGQFPSAIEGLTTYLGAGAYELTGGRIGRELVANDPRLMNTFINNTLRQERTGDVTEKYGDLMGTLYGFGMSTLDNVARMYAFGGMGAAGTILSSTTMYGTVAASTMQEYMEKGAGAKKALLAGGLRAGAEALGESFDMGAFLELKSLKQAGQLTKSIKWRYLGKNVITEGSSEGITSFAEKIVDYMLLQDESEVAQIWQGVKDAGGTNGEAWWEVVKQSSLDAFVDFAGGAFSGFFLSGSNLVFTGIKNGRAAANAQAAAGLAGDVDAASAAEVAYASTLMKNGQAMDPKQRLATHALIEASGMTEEAKETLHGLIDDYGTCPEETTSEEAKKNLAKVSEAVAEQSRKQEEINLAAEERIAKEKAKLSKEESDIRELHRKMTEANAAGDVETANRYAEEIRRRSEAYSEAFAEAEAEEQRAKRKDEIAMEKASVPVYTVMTEMENGREAEAQSQQEKVSAMREYDRQVAETVEQAANMKGEEDGAAYPEPGAGQTDGRGLYQDNANEVEAVRKDDGGYRNDTAGAGSETADIRDAERSQKDTIKDTYRTDIEEAVAAWNERTGAEITADSFVRKEDSAYAQAAANLKPITNMDCVIYANDDENAPPAFSKDGRIYVKEGSTKASTLFNYGHEVAEQTPGLLAVGRRIFDSLSDPDSDAILSAYMRKKQSASAPLDILQDAEAETKEMICDMFGILTSMVDDETISEEQACEEAGVPVDLFRTMAEGFAQAIMEEAEEMENGDGKTLRNEYKELYETARATDSGIVFSAQEMTPGDPATETQQAAADILSDSQQLLFEVQAVDTRSEEEKKKDAKKWEAKKRRREKTARERQERYKETVRSQGLFTDFDASAAREFIDESAKLIKESRASDEKMDAMLKALQEQFQEAKTKTPNAKKLQKLINDMLQLHGSEADNQVVFEAVQKLQENARNADLEDPDTFDRLYAEAESIAYDIMAEIYDEDYDNWLEESGTTQYPDLVEYLSSITFDVSKKERQALIKAFGSWKNFRHETAGILHVSAIKNENTTGQKLTRAESILHEDLSENSPIRTQAEQAFNGAYTTDIVEIAEFLLDQFAGAKQRKSVLETWHDDIIEHEADEIVYTILTEAYNIPNEKTYKEKGAAAVRSVEADVKKLAAEVSEQKERTEQLRQANKAQVDELNAAIVRANLDYRKAYKEMQDEHQNEMIASAEKDGRIAELEKQVSDLAKWKERRLNKISKSDMTAEEDLVKASVTAADLFAQGITPKEYTTGEYGTPDTTVLSYLETTWKKTTAIQRLRSATRMFNEGKTPLDYFHACEEKGIKYDMETASLLRGMLLKSGKAQGGKLSTNDMLDLTAHKKNWVQYRSLRLQSTSPARVFENLGAWRKNDTAERRAANYNEGNMLRDKLYGYVANQGSLQTTWEQEARAKIEEAFSGGGMDESVLAQMLGEHLIFEADLDKVISDDDHLLVPVIDGWFLFGRNRELLAFSDSEETFVVGKEYQRKLQKNGIEGVTIEEIMSGREEKRDTLLEKAVNKVKPKKYFRIDAPIEVDSVWGETKVYLPGGITVEMKSKNKPDAKIVTGTAEALREFYDKSWNEIADTRVENGYAPPGKIKDYFPHMQHEAMSIEKMFANDLPTSIAGMTEFFKPGTPWCRNMLKRTGPITEFDAIRGFNSYVKGASDIIFMTPAVQRLRQFETALRDELDSTNSSLVSWVHDYTNALANKKAAADRGMEEVVGREVYSLSSFMTGNIGKSAVVGNVSSAVSNVISLISALPTSDPISVAKNGWKVLTGQADEQLIKKIPFLNRRENGYENILTGRRGGLFGYGMKDTTKARINKAMGLMFAATDKFTTETVALAKYDELRRKGMDEATAIKETDAYCIKLFADRVKGVAPTLFNKKTMKLFTQFQLEVLNQMSHPRDIKRQSLDEDAWNAIDWEKYNEDLQSAADTSVQAPQAEAISGKPAKELLRYAMYALLMSIWGQVTGNVMGRRQTWDPIGTAARSVEGAVEGFEKDGIKGAASGAGQAISDEIMDNAPFVSLFTNGGRVPAFSSIENMGNFISVLFDDDYTAGAKAIEAMKAMGSFVTGGGQISKTVRGIKALKDGGYYNAKGNRLYTPADASDPGDIIRALLFGPSALTRDPDFDYTADALNEKRTGYWEKLREQGYDPEAAYEIVKGYRGSTNAEKSLSLIAGIYESGAEDPEESFDIIAEILGYESGAKRYEPDMDLKEFARAEYDSRVEALDKAVEAGDKTKEKADEEKERLDAYLDMIIG